MTRLLRGVLKGEWGFTGVVASDWDATRSTVPTAVGGLDLAMPGPDSPWGAGPGRARSGPARCPRITPLPAASPSALMTAG